MTHVTPPTDGPRDAIVQRLERLIARLLRWGVLLSLALMLAGTVIRFVGPDHYLNTHDQTLALTQKGDAFPLDLGWLLSGLASLRGEALVVLGLVVLIATPTLRVAVSIVAYALERDRLFVAITGAVLLLLAISMMLGGLG